MLTGAERRRQDQPDRGDVAVLAPGRGLRRATLEDVAFTEGDGGWAVAAEIEGMLGLATLGTGIDPPAGEDASPPRRCRIDREPVGSAAAFADHLRVIWLMPAMDRLFNGPASERRRFLDRLVLAVDAQHASRVSALERVVALAQPAARGSAHAIRTGSTRSSTRPRRSRWRSRPRAPRPWRGCRRRLTAARGARRRFRPPRSRSKAGSKKLLPTHSAVEVEDRYRAVLRDNRARDAAAGRTLDGPHLTDLAVTLRRQGHRRRRRLDRRAEGAADPPGAGACAG